MSIFWKVTISAIATYQLVLTFWLYRAAEAVYGMLSNSAMSFEETGLPDEMRRGLFGWAAALASICLVTALVSRWWAAAVAEPK